MTAQTFITLRPPVSRTMATATGMKTQEADMVVRTTELTEAASRGSRSAASMRVPA